MKTFSRKRGSSQLGEPVLTNGTSDELGRPQNGSTVRTDTYSLTCSSESNGSAGRRLTKDLRASPSHSESPLPEVGSKRKLEGLDASNRMKEARVERPTAAKVFERRKDVSGQPSQKADAGAPRADVNPITRYLAKTPSDMTVADKGAAGPSRPAGAPPMPSAVTAATVAGPELTAVKGSEHRQSSKPPPAPTPAFTVAPAAAPAGPAATDAGGAQGRQGPGTGTDRPASSSKSLFKGRTFSKGPGLGLTTAATADIAAAAAAHPCDPERLPGGTTTAPVPVSAQPSCVADGGGKTAMAGSNHDGEGAPRPVLPRAAAVPPPQGAETLARAETLALLPRPEGHDRPQHQAHTGQAQGRPPSGAAAAAVERSRMRQGCRDGGTTAHPQPPPQGPQPPATGVDDDSDPGDMGSAGEQPLNAPRRRPPGSAAGASTPVVPAVAAAPAPAAAVVPRAPRSASVPPVTATPSAASGGLLGSEPAASGGAAVTALRPGSQPLSGTSGTSGRAGRPIGRGRLPGALPPTGNVATTASAGGGVTAAGTGAGAQTTAAGRARGPGAAGSSGRDGVGASFGAAGPMPGASAGGGGGRSALKHGSVAAAAAGGGGGEAGATAGAGRGPRVGSQGDSVAGGAGNGGGGGGEPAAHSIVEAQERGEMLQLQDDALYALDGLRQAAERAAQVERAASAGASTAAGSQAAVGAPGPGPGAGSASVSALAREPAAALAGMLATRRGRAALSRPTNLAQQALTALARTNVVPLDPLAALAAAVVLLALVQEDALPAYGASYAAAVLMRQVLQQAEKDLPPLLQQPPAAPADGANPPGASASTAPRPTAAATAPGVAGATPPSAWSLLQQARGLTDAAGGAGTGGKGGGSGGALGAAEVATARRLLRLVQEGPMARQVGRPDLVVGPLPVALLAMVAASETAPARIQFTERFKNNLPKVGLLPVLGRLIAARRDAVVRYLADKQRAACATAGVAAAVAAEAAALASAAAAGVVEVAAATTALQAPPAGAAAPTTAIPSAAEAGAATEDGGGSKNSLSTPGPSFPGQAAPAATAYDFPADDDEDGDGGGGGAAAAGDALRNPGVAADPYAFKGTPSQPPEPSQPPPASLPPSRPPPEGLAAPLWPAPPPPPAAPPAPLPPWLFWELQLLLRVLENATFTHHGNENALLGLRVATALPVPHAAEAAAAVAAAACSGAAAHGEGGREPLTLMASQPTQQLQPLRISQSQPQASSAWEGSQPFALFGSQPRDDAALMAAGAGSQPRGDVLLGSSQPRNVLSQPLSQPTLELMEIQRQAVAAEATASAVVGGGGGADAAEASAAAAGTPFAAVLVDVVRQLAALTDEDNAGSGAAGNGNRGENRGNGGQRGALGAAATAAAAAGSLPSPVVACQMCTAVLMNLTHEHADGVAAVAAAGGLQAVGGLIWRCCRPEALPAAVSATPPVSAAAPSVPLCPGGQSHEQRLAVSRSTIVAHIEVLSVSLGLLINMTSKSPQNQRSLRCAQLATTIAATTTGPSSLAAPPQPREVEASQQPGAVLLASAIGGSYSSDGSGSGGGGRMVPLLCAILNAMTPGLPQKKKKPLDPPVRTAAASPAAARAPAAAGGDYKVEDDDEGGGSGSQGQGDEVTEAALSEDQAGGQASIAQVYSAILLGYLIAGTEDEEEQGEEEAVAAEGMRWRQRREGAAYGNGASQMEVVAAGGHKGGSAAAARAEARRLLGGGSLRPVTSGISRCLTFYCRAGAITEGSRDALVGLLQRLMRLEVVENESAFAACAAAAAAGSAWDDLGGGGSGGSDMDE